MSPEVIKQSGYSTPADIWSLGITAIELAIGQPPHSNLHPLKALFLIPKEDAPVLPSTFSKNFQDFVSSCLQHDPLKRPTVKELLKHKFIKQTKLKPLTDLIKQREKYLEESRVELSILQEDILDPVSIQDDWDFGTIKAEKQVQKSEDWDFGTVKSPKLDEIISNYNDLSITANIKSRSDVDKYYPFQERNNLVDGVLKPMFECLELKDDSIDLKSLRDAFVDAEYSNPGIVMQLYKELKERLE